MKKNIGIVLVCGLLFGVMCTGCGETKESKSVIEHEVETQKYEKISIDDLNWRVTDGLVDGNRAVTFEYTNNSEYTILDFIIKFNLKDGLTAEQLAAFDSLKTDGGFTDEDIKNVYIDGYNHRIANPGETLTSSPCSINGTFRQVDTMDQYNLTQPDTATIAYIDDNKVYFLYYDFKSGTYSEGSDSGSEAFVWPSTEIASTLPVPDLMVGQLSKNNEDGFFFGGFGVTKEFFQEYVELCKTHGYTVDQDDRHSVYKAKNEAGYQLQVFYEKNNQQMSIRLDK